MSERGVGEVVGLYRRAKAAKERLAEEHKAAMRPVDETIEQLKMALQRHMRDAGVRSVRTDEGTVSLSNNYRAKVRDWDDFLVFVGENDSWHLLTKSCGSRACIDYWREHGESPTGIDITHEIGLRVTAPRKGVTSHHTGDEQ